jgi:hypothetical protein
MRQSRGRCAATSPPQVLAVSSAATVFKLMAEVPPITLAAWRLQLTTLLLLPGAVVQYRALQPGVQREVLSNGAWLAGSGACLAAHFALWVWSLEHTTLAHSLLLVSTAPIILTAVALATRQPISRGEIGGAALAVAGAVRCGAAWGRAPRPACAPQRRRRSMHCHAPDSSRGNWLLPGGRSIACS